MATQAKGNRGLKTGSILTEVEKDGRGHITSTITLSAIEAMTEYYKFMRWGEYKTD